VNETHDITRQDYSWTPRDGGLSGSVASWTGRKPREGDFLILGKGGRTARYRVVDVDLCMNVDPPTMWIARVEFAPREFNPEKVAAAKANGTWPEEVTQ